MVTFFQQQCIYMCFLQCSFLPLTCTSHVSRAHRITYKGISVLLCACAYVHADLCLCVCVCREAISRLCARTLLKTAVKTKRVRLVYTDRHTLILTHALFLEHSAGITVVFVIISLFARDCLLFWVKPTCSFLEAGSSSLSPPTV